MNVLSARIRQPRSGSLRRDARAECRRGARRCEDVVGRRAWCPGSRARPRRDGQGTGPDGITRHSGREIRLLPGSGEDAVSDQDVANPRRFVRRAERRPNLFVGEDPGDGGEGLEMLVGRLLGHEQAEDKVDGYVIG